MNIAVGSDHAGFEKKQRILAWLGEKQYTYFDFGTYSADSVDYPDYARAVANAVAQGKFEQGILLCGSGVGVSIVANKVKGIRAALVFNPEIARLARAHNDANIMCLPARFMSDADMLQCLENWFAASFEGGRHAQRVSKIELDATCLAPYHNQAS
ncbi:MAG: ribose 5-phosphate isomerase B [Chloroherpetonaceae bacterium]|nr:ribose 5-phosphate isomerase B [Chloroherpetonaceae bacterium]MCS7212367.1 ribose 5-phosphate isomerase B [Chloroherpetonaceae bacterium]MDW8018570.1 ribose 5-phosphate isomerase B [Chloroherpetonaceae bacterium]MDW8467330.1 ribose 5-phosphate isomerase B [Chloroherpetonaceae bacterium]